MFNMSMIENEMTRLVCFFQTSISVLHEHATLKMVQRYLILLSKLYEVVLLQVSVQLRKMRAAKALSAHLCLNISTTNQACSYLSKRILVALTGN